MTPENLGDRVQAHERFERAKRQFTAAARAVLDGDPEGALLARIALARVEEARAELRRLTEETET